MQVGKILSFTTQTKAAASETYAEIMFTVRSLVRPPICCLLRACFDVLRFLRGWDGLFD